MLIFKLIEVQDLHTFIYSHKEGFLNKEINFKNEEIMIYYIL